VENAAELRLSGWVIDAAAGTVPQVVFVRVEAEDKGRVWYAPVSLTVERPDVASTRGGANAVRRSGFDAKVDARTLPAGVYRLQIVYRATGSIVCDNGRRVVVD
jgi:hypothetical protein